MGPDTGPVLILASSSPRRKVLMGAFGRPFTIRVPHVREELLPGEDVAGHVRRLALEKAAEVAKHFDAGLVVAADTVVVLDGEIIGKPADTDEACRILSRLAGRTHRVYSGVAVQESGGGETRSEVVCSEVTMAGIEPAEIRRYVDTGEPLDKAGAYAVQGEGSRFVVRVDGSMTNVIGLPLRELNGLLLSFGCPVTLPDMEL